jgi:hypothetical protein
VPVPIYNIPQQKMYKNIYSKTHLRWWEDFINDGREIACIAQIIECNYKFKGFPEDAMDYLKNTIGIAINDPDNIGEESIKIYIMELFKYHSKMRNIRICESVEKWLDKFEKTFPDGSCKVLREIYKDTEWDWEDISNL